VDPGHGLAVVAGTGCAAYATPYPVRDLWTGPTTVAFTSLAAGTLPPHGSTKVRISAP
jgi:hypothetical protein